MFKSASKTAFHCCICLVMTEHGEINKTFFCSCKTYTIFAKWVHDVLPKGDLWNQAKPSLVFYAKGCRMLSVYIVIKWQQIKMSKTHQSLRKYWPSLTGWSGNLTQRALQLINYYYPSIGILFESFVFFNPRIYFQLLIPKVQGDFVYLAVQFIVTFSVTDLHRLHRSD